MKINNREGKRSWSAPKLKVHGTVEEITQQIVKNIGPNDNLVLIANSNITIGS
jgi:hypothetical protein